MKAGARRCKAKSSRSGKPCRKAPIRGGTVCTTHGGSAPQVKASARERLAALAEPAIGVLGALLKRTKAPHVQLGAARDVLDRTGFKAPTVLEANVTTAPARIDLAKLSREERVRYRQLVELQVAGGTLTPAQARELVTLRARTRVTAEP